MEPVFMQGISGTSAVAVEFTPAILALRFRVAFALLELALQFRPRDAIPEVSHAIGFIPDKRVAREQLLHSVTARYSVPIHSP